MIDIKELQSDRNARQIRQDYDYNFIITWCLYFALAYVDF